MFEYGRIQRYNLSARGGTDLLRYFASFGHNDVEGSTPIDWDIRTSGRLSLSVVPNEQLSIDVNVAIVNGETRLATDWWTNFIYSNPATITTPLRGLRYQRPEDAIHGIEEFVYSERTTWSVQAQYNPTEWLSNRLVIGGDYARHRQEEIHFKDPEGFGLFYRTAGREGQKEN